MFLFEHEMGETISRILPSDKDKGRTASVVGCFTLWLFLATNFCFADPLAKWPISKPVLIFASAGQKPSEPTVPVPCR